MPALDYICHHNIYHIKKMLLVAQDYIFFKRCLLHSAANLLPLCKKMTS